MNSLIFFNDGPLLSRIGVTYLNSIALGLCIFLFVFAGCTTTETTEINTTNEIQKDAEQTNQGAPDTTGIEYGWDFIGITNEVDIQSGTYFSTPLFTKLVAVGGDTIVLEFIGVGIFYFDKLDPSEVADLIPETTFVPEQPIVVFPLEFDR